MTTMNVTRFPIERFGPHDKHMEAIATLPAYTLTRFLFKQTHLYTFATYEKTSVFFGGYDSIVKLVGVQEKTPIAARDRQKEPGTEPVLGTSRSSRSRYHRKNRPGTDSRFHVGTEVPGKYA